MRDMQEALRSHAKELEEKYFHKSLTSWDVVHSCVDKSTIRSFQERRGCTKIYKPLSIFRVWAYDYLTNDTSCERIRKDKEFSMLREHAEKSLKKFWKNEDGGTPSFYQFNKLIDLFFKALPRWQICQTGESNGYLGVYMFPWIHIPWHFLEITTRGMVFP